MSFSTEGPNFVPMLFEPRLLPGVHNLTKGTVIDIILQASPDPFLHSFASLTAVLIR